MSKRKSVKASNIKNSVDDKDLNMEKYETDLTRNSSSDKTPLINNSSTNSSGLSAKAPIPTTPPSNGLLAVCFGGIFFSYLIFGILQEKITRGKYDEEGKDKFTFIFCLVFLQCVINTIVAKMILISKRGSARDFVIDKTPALLYFLAGCSYVGAMVCSNKSLAYVSYPTQVIGKACKPIAVLILGIFWAGKRYGIKKFLCITLIVIGVALFMYNPDKAAKNTNETGLGWGELLLLSSLMLDGFTGVFQEKMRSDAYKTTEHNMMFNMNKWSCVALLVLILFSGEHTRFLEFQAKYPQVWGMILVYSLCSAVGQHFIFVTVVTFGPLMCSVITTTRKFFTVLCSVILFRNPMSNQQWFATLLVFMGLGLDIVYGKKDKKVVVKKP